VLLFIVAFGTSFGGKGGFRGQRLYHSKEWWWC